MSSMNKVILIGHLGKDPESRTFPSGDLVTNVTIATSEKWKDKQSGEMKEATEWHRVVFNGRTAEVAQEYLRKGSLICVEGSLRTRKYTDQAGVEKYTTEIRADRLQMLGGRPDDGGGNQRQAPQGNQRQAPQGNQRQAPQGNGQQQPQQQRQAPQGGGYSNGGGQRAPQNQQRQAPQTQQRPQNNGGSGFDDMDDDIPF